jgi:hypothetical protein
MWRSHFWGNCGKCDSVRRADPTESPSPAGCTSSPMSASDAVIPEDRPRRTITHCHWCGRRCLHSSARGSCAAALAPTMIPIQSGYACRSATDGSRAPSGSAQPRRWHPRSVGPRSRGRVTEARSKFCSGRLLFQPGTAAVPGRDLPGQSPVLGDHRQVTITLCRRIQFVAGDCQTPADEAAGRIVHVSRLLPAQGSALVPKLSGCAVRA